MKLRKLIILLVITISVPYQLFAQSIPNKNSISLSFGPSFAVGDFASTNPENSLSGYAKTGVTAKLSFSYKLTKEFGLEAMVCGQRNGLQTSVFEKQLGESAFFQDARTYSNWQVKKKHWLTGSVLAGVTLEYPVNHSSKISIKTKALAGLALMEAPDLIAESKFGNAYATYTGIYGSSTAPAVLLGTEIKYPLNKHFSFFINADYFMTTKISFKDATEIIIATDGGLIIPDLYNFQNSVNHPVIFGQTGTRKQPIKSLNLNIGISFSW